MSGITINNNNNNNSNNNNDDDGFCDDVSIWSREQDKAFEDAIATYDGIINDTKWEIIASVVPGGKSVDEIKHHYEMLVDDVSKIESGFVPLPCYNSSGFDDQQSSSGEGSVRGGGERKVGRSEHERRKGIAWSEEEHRLFLLGLEKFGKGDWRSISRNFVVTRTPTQVASHAQKYFIRMNSMNKERRRTSIHDITSAVIDNGADGLLPPQ